MRGDVSRRNISPADGDEQSSRWRVAGGDLAGSGARLEGVGLSAACRRSAGEAADPHQGKGRAVRTAPVPRWRCHEQGTHDDHDGQKRLNENPLRFAGWMQPAEVVHAVLAGGQDMLQIAAHELRGRHGIILHDSTPDKFRLHLRDVAQQVKSQPADQRIIFLKSWNEWAEGNYLEPNLRFGDSYLKVIKEELGGGNIELPST